MKCPDCGHENLAGEENCLACHTPLALLSLPQPRGHDRIKILEGKVTDIGPRLALSMPATKNVSEAVRLMRVEKMGCVLVTDGGGQLVGIFTERDLLMRVANQKDPFRTPLKTVMKSDPICLDEEDTIAFAFHTMALQGFRHVPIRRKDGKYAIISSRDLLRYLCQ